LAKSAALNATAPPFDANANVSIAINSNRTDKMIANKVHLVSYSCFTSLAAYFYVSVQTIISPAQSG
jgi:hypothetical protein